MKVNLHFDSTVNEAQRAKFNYCASLMEKVLASEKFKQSILSHKYKVSKTTGVIFKKTVTSTVVGFAWNGGKTRQQVYDFIQAGSESLDKTSDQECDISIIIEKGKAGVLGRTNPSTRWQWISKWFLDSATVPELCGNLMHEWLHKQGFTHAGDRTTERPYTVPYAVGYLMRDLVQLYLSSGQI
jgi:hypothetical protein